MRPHEYARFDGVGLAELVARGEVSPSELTETAIERIEEFNPALNAVVLTLYERARERSRSLGTAAEPRPLRGVPMLLKDILGDVQGVPSTSGSRFLRAVPAPADAELVVRFERAGLVPLGKTNTPEFGLLPTTEPQLYGPCRNPWQLEYSCGGSSGGSAAAVAAGLVPIAHANDGGGSIRIPAACCGLVGLKPTRARNPLGPRIGDIMNGLVVEHVVTRSVRDSALVLDCTAGSDPGAPYVAPPPERPYREEVGRDPGRLRIAFSTRTLRGGSVHPECVAAVQASARLCAGLGHDVEEAQPPFAEGGLAPQALIDAYMAIWASGCTATIDSIGRATGRTPDAAYFEPLTWGLYQRGQQVSAAAYQMAHALLQRAGRAMARFHEHYDLWMTPTLGAPPVRLGTFDTDEPDPEKAFAPLFDYASFTGLFNATGQPALSLPLHWSAEGLPVGVHFAARFGDEGLLFRLAGQLETARPWQDRRPPPLRRDDPGAPR